MSNLKYNFGANELLAGLRSMAAGDSVCELERQFGVYNSQAETRVDWLARAFSGLEYASSMPMIVREALEMWVPRDTAAILVDLINLSIVFPAARPLEPFVVIVRNGKLESIRCEQDRRRAVTAIVRACIHLGSTEQALLLLHELHDHNTLSVPSTARAILARRLMTPTGSIEWPRHVQEFLTLRNDGPINTRSKLVARATVAEIASENHIIQGAVSLAQSVIPIFENSNEEDADRPEMVLFGAFIGGPREGVGDDTRLISIEEDRNQLGWLEERIISLWRPSADTAFQKITIHTDAPNGDNDHPLLRAHHLWLTQGQDLNRFWSRDQLKSNIRLSNGSSVDGFNKANPSAGIATMELSN